MEGRLILTCCIYSFIGIKQLVLLLGMFSQSCCIYSFIGIKQRVLVDEENKDPCCIYSFIGIKQHKSISTINRWTCCIYSFIGIRQQYCLIVLLVDYLYTLFYRYWTNGRGYILIVGGFKRDISSEMSLYFLLYLLYGYQIGTHKDER